MNLQELEIEVQKIKARSAADTAFIRCAMFTLGTEQLRSTIVVLESLAESMAVGLMFMKSASDEANHEFEARRNFWIDALRSEIAARDSAEPPR